MHALYDGSTRSVFCSDLERLIPSPSVRFGADFFGTRATRKPVLSRAARLSDPQLPSLNQFWKVSFIERDLECVISADAARGGFPRAALLLTLLVCLLFCGKSVSAKQCQMQAFPLSQRQSPRRLASVQLRLVCLAPMIRVISRLTNGLLN